MQPIPGVSDWFSLRHSPRKRCRSFRKTCCCKATLTAMLGGAQFLIAAIRSVVLRAFRRKSSPSSVGHALGVPRRRLLRYRAPQARGYVVRVITGNHREIAVELPP